MYQGFELLLSRNSDTNGVWVGKVVETSAIVLYFTVLHVDPFNFNFFYCMSHAFSNEPCDG